MNQRMLMKDEVRDGDVLLAIILRDGHQDTGVHFHTQPDLPMQVASMRRAKGEKIAPHTHQWEPRLTNTMSEFLVVMRGVLAVDFYGCEGQHVKRALLYRGDAVLLLQGGHGFEVIEEVELFECKQGPHQPMDKRVIDPNPWEQMR